MIKTFTQNDLIRYVYHETTEREAREINKALICDAELQEQYKALVATKHQMEDARLVPSPSTLQNILSYSRALQEKR